MLEIATAHALVHAAQLNVIEFHTWNATVKSIENPDRLLFDLDPGEGVQWQQVVEGTMLVKAFLDELKLKSFLKTSGGKGLHVVVPLKPAGKLGRSQRFFRGDRRSSGAHCAATFRREERAKKSRWSDFYRLLAQYSRRYHGCRLLRARAAWIGRLDAIRWDELEGLEEREPVEHHERAQSIGKATDGSVAGLQAHTADDQTCGANTFGRLKGDQWQPH